MTGSTNMGRRTGGPLLQRLIGLAMALFGSLASAGIAQIPERAPDKVLQGTLVPADGASYRNLDFDLPVGTNRLVVALGHDGDPRASLIELGLADPEGFRGASSRRVDFTIAPTDATPGYLAGRLLPGRWQLRFSVGFLPAGRDLNWTVKLWYMKAGERLPSLVPSRGPGWYRGDLHVHSGHSDGSCASRSGQSAPCPLHATIAAAADRKLDFLMLTEHNTVSQLQVLREVQPHFDRTLLIPGQEVTTFFGHINVWGVEEPIDYRIAPGLQSFNALADRVHALGGLLSINHPMATTGASCLGCGWTMQNVDYARVDAVEAINGGIIGAIGGGDAEGKLSNLPFWLAHLDAGDRLIGVGGSDSHDGTNAADHPPAVGNPTTVVYARDLTQTAIIDGIREGRLFIDLAMNPDALLDLQLSDGRQTVAMGGRMQPGAKVSAQVTVRAPQGVRLELLDGSVLLASRTIDGERGSEAQLTVPLALSRRSHAVRAQVRNGEGKLILVSNPVFVAAR